MPFERSLQADLLRALAACAAVLAIPAAGPSGGRAELVYLAIIAAPALLAVARLAPRPAAELGLGAALAVLAAWTLPPSPTRSAALVVVVTAALVVAASRAAARRPWTPGEWTLLLLALQTLGRGDLLLQPGLARAEVGHVVSVFLLMPVIAAVAARRIAATAGASGAGAALLIASLQGGLHVANTSLLCALAVAAWTLRGRFDLRQTGGAWALACGVFAAAIAVVAALPWLSRQPLRAVVHLPAELVAAARAHDLLGGGELVLDVAEPAWESAVPGQVSSVVVVANLDHAATMADGTPVATLEATAEDGAVERKVLRSGSDTGEWAARRSDVLAAAPAAWQSSVEGDFFAQRYRASWQLAEPRRLKRLRIVREPALPPATKLAFFAVEVRP